MATLYFRGEIIWLAYGHGKERKQISTKFRRDQWDEALKVKAAVEAKEKARAGAGLDRPRSVGGWRKTWLERRAAYPSAKDDAARLKHARELDNLLLSEIRVSHVRALISRLRNEATLAPRTIRHVYTTLHKMFADASSDDLLVKNPCDLGKGELPAKRDADPNWRSGAVFTRLEVERLLSDEVVPQERRTLYALLFLTGARIGEVSALRWSSLSHGEPLGRLSVATSYQRKAKKEKGVKTDQPRLVPVHPVLARVLAQWRLSGWEAYVGRKPKDADLLIPSYRGQNLRDPVVHENLLRDLDKLGMRPRRTHDARRTFISLALADGARKDILRWVTHGPPADIMDLYTTLPWEALCSAVAQLNVRLNTTATSPLHRLQPPKQS